MGGSSQCPRDLDIKNCEDRIRDLSWSTSQVSAKMDLTTREQVMEHANSSVEVHAIMETEPIDGVISRSVALSGNAIRACQTRKVISKHGVGVNNIDVEAATRRNIPVYVTLSANARSVAELALGLFAAARRCNGRRCSCQYSAVSLR